MAASFFCIKILFSDIIKNATFDFEMLHFYYQIIYRSDQKKLNPNINIFKEYFSYRPHPFLFGQYQGTVLLFHKKNDCICS